MSESSSDEDMTPAELVQTVHNSELSFLPEKSREKYIKAYDIFNTWSHSKGAKTISEDILVSYFTELSKTRKSSTLWSIYSMLKATIKAKNEIHIENYPKLLEFVKKQSTGHKPKKSKIFTASNIQRFLKEASDYEFLSTKVVLIIGISGACRTNELTFLTTKSIEKHSDKLLLVNLPNTKLNIDRNFVIRDEYVKIVEKYQALRPADTPHDRFFLQYRKGKCFKHPIGCTKIGGIPREIATFLGLKDPEEYTGHCFRRTSTVLSSDSGADLTTLRRHIDPPAKSSTVTEKYIKDIAENKPKLHKGITRGLKIALVQLAVGPDKSQNVARAVEEIHRAKQAGAHLVALPECFNSPYGTKFFDQYAEEVPVGETSRALSRAAAEAGVCVVGGTVPERCGAQLYNTCTVWDASGKLLAQHRKMHLFDIDIPNKITFKESEVLSAGDQLTTFEFRGVKIGLGICYDLRFPEMAHLMANSGCSLLIYPGAFNMTTGPKHWELLGRARANDQQLWVALVSPARDTTAGYVAWGHSTLLDPWGAVVATLDEKPGLLMGDIDLDTVEEVRSQIPIRRQRRTDIYDTVRVSK